MNEYTVKLTASQHFALERALRVALANQIHHAEKAKEFRNYELEEYYLEEIKEYKDLWDVIRNEPVRA